MAWKSKDPEGYVLDVGTHANHPDRCLVTCSRPDHYSVSVSLKFTQVLMLSAALSEWLAKQAAENL